MVVFSPASMRTHIGSKDLASAAYSRPAETDASMPTFACCNSIFLHHLSDSSWCLHQEFQNSIFFALANLTSEEGNPCSPMGICKEEGDIAQVSTDGGGCKDTMDKNLFLGTSISDRWLVACWKMTYRDDAFYRKCCDTSFHNFRRMALRHVQDDRHEGNSHKGKGQLRDIRPKDKEGNGTFFHPDFPFVL